MKTVFREEIAGEYNATPKTKDVTRKWPSPVQKQITWKEYRETRRGEVISSPDDVVDFFNRHMGGMSKEVFVALYLDHRNHALYCDAQMGTVDHTAVYPREILATALGFDASGLIIAHNHPAGSLEPSEGDKALTRQILTASRAMGITVHDHLIITDEGHFSFRQAGLLV